jgi:hypothetical protein
MDGDDAAVAEQSNHSEFIPLLLGSQKQCTVNENNKESCKRRRCCCEEGTTTTTTTTVAGRLRRIFQKLWTRLKQFENGTRSCGIVAAYRDKLCDGLV